MTRATCLCLWAAAFGCCFDVPGAETAPAPANVPSLRAAAAPLFHMGVGISDRIASLTREHSLLLRHFDYVTPENCMKPAAVQPAEGAFQFGVPDEFVAFASDHKLGICGHCLVWAKDDRTPGWFYLDGERPAAREKLLERMRTHIRATMGRYRGRIGMWDVVNEALDDGTNFLRPSGWVSACGEDFIAEAFREAHAVDPDALLIYNDYGNESGPKRDKTIRLIRSLREKKVPVHAVGLQGHYELDEVPFGELEAMLAALRDLGVKVVVSELDIDVVKRSRWWADGGKHRGELSRYDPYAAGCPPEVLQRQAEQYARLFEIYRRHPGVVVRVSFWNLHDGQSWLNYFPWRRANYPLLFDRQRMPKPAFDAVLEILKRESKGEP